MPFLVVLLLAACWQVSLQLHGGIAPVGWAEILVPLPPNEVLGVPGRSQGQVGQDKIVQSILKCKRNGFYLDLAANDAVYLSNTLMLERDFGWSGICIEANPKYILELAKRRHCQVVLAAVGTPSNQEVTFAFKDELGGIVDDKFDNKPSTVTSPTVKMRTKALSEILSELSAPKVIDFLSLDVEGAESLVMKGFPWDAYRFRVITVERPQADLVAVLKSKGYHYLRSNADFGDQTWVDTEISEGVMALVRAGGTAPKDWGVPSDEVFQRTCPADTQACSPPAEKFNLPGKDCGSSGCLNQNYGFATFAEAWTACGKTASCGAIMRYKGDYYLRRIEDPDRNDGHGVLSSMVYSCE